MTCKPAFAVPPEPPSLDVTFPVTLVHEPRVTPAIDTETVQVPLAVMLPPARTIELEPTGAVTVPPQELVSPFGAATIMPAGSGSLMPSPLSESGFGLSSLNVRLALLPSGIEVAPIAFAIVGG